MTVIATIEAKLGRQLRPFQKEAVAEIVEGHDVIVSAPTGSGKTEIFLAASQALRQDGVTLIVSPLVALVRDQVRRYESRGFHHVAFHGQIKQRDRRMAYDAIAGNQVDIVITTVESFLSNESLQKALSRCGVAMIVIDEAHVFEDWGYSFRPGYRRLGATCRRLKVKQAMLASGTMGSAGCVEAAESLGRWDWKVVSMPPDRPNLMYCPVALQNKPRQLAKFIQDPQYPGPGIIYFQTVFRLEQVAAGMKTFLGYAPATYHGQMSPKSKNEAQDTWMKSADGWILATNAFGMGIDRADVRTIIHTDLTSSLMDYAQESGRAGRDGQQSWCWLNSTDSGSSAEFLTLRNYPEEEDLISVFEFLVAECGIGEWKRMPGSEIAKAMGWDGNQADSMVRTCRGWLSGSGLIVGRRARRDYQIDLYPGCESQVSSKQAEMLEAVRGAGKFELDPSTSIQCVTASKDQLATACEPIYKGWQKQLLDMHKKGVIQYASPDKAGQIKVISEEFRFDCEKLRRAKWRARRRLEAMQAFNHLPWDQRPKAIHDAINMRDDEILDELKKYRPKEAETAIVDATESLIPEIETHVLLPTGVHGTVGGTVNYPGNNVASFVNYNDPITMQAHSFIAVFGEIGSKWARKAYPAFPIYTLTELIVLSCYSREEQARIHRVLPGLGGRLDAPTEILLSNRSASSQKSAISSILISNRIPTFKFDEPARVS